ncbi:hypothetical protein [Fusobacterium nucleatum]|uniref:Uncharacterized protein n=1 Tax=Fusobacterium nucleatum TaxID=851 RepID=A0A133NQM6_FUSNU|nr:hypothetical protein [Fusobacterium nucleatum]KXA18596.1 hypothetical protein HMPREF3221_01647 [Fusobacterium nucleatum]
MEKLEIKLVNNFICDVARFIEHKDNIESGYRKHPMRDFNWDFIDDSSIFDNEIFKYIRSFNFEMKILKERLLDKEKTRNEKTEHRYHISDICIKYLIEIYKIMKKTENFNIFHGFKDIVEDCYQTILKDLYDYNKNDNTLYINDIKILEFLDDISSENMPENLKEIANDLGRELDTNNKDSLKEIADIIREDDENFRIGLHWENLSEARKLAFEI